jgi:hypothetical protein
MNSLRDFLRRLSEGSRSFDLFCEKLEYLSPGGIIIRSLFPEACFRRCAAAASLCEARGRLSKKKKLAMTVVVGNGGKNGR